MDGIKVTILKNSLNRVVEKRDEFLFSIEKTLPCILYMENRVSEKLITMCLAEGLKHRTAGVNTKSYFTEIDSMVNNGILSEENGNWKLPINGDTLSPVNFCNTSARTFGTKVGMLFDIIFHHHSDNNLRINCFYIYVVTFYQDIMNKARKRSNMSRYKIITLQQLIDAWYDKWIGLTGREGMPNYVHMLGSGHVTYYLRKSRNLHRYGNQSWECFNKRVKRCYLTKT